MKKIFITNITSFIAISLFFATTPSIGKAQDSEKEPDTFSIKTNKGVPFIAKNGKPQRGRMFYGSYPGGTFKVVKTDWQTVSMEVSPTIDTQHAGIRMNFDGKVKNIFIKKITLKNLTANDEKILFDALNPILSNTIKNTNPKRATMKIEDGALHISKDNDAKKPAIRFLIENLALKASDKYQVDVEVKYDERGWFDMVAYANGIIGQSAEKTFIKQLKHAAKNEVNFVTLGFPTFTDPTKIEEYERTCQTIIGDIIKNNPKAKIIPRLGADASPNWLDQNPDSEMRNFDGTPTTRVTNGNMPIVQRFAAVSSKKYRQHISEILQRTVEFLESRYGDHIAGYHPSGANTGEWFYAQSYSETPTGYDKSTLSAWREWLAKKYSTNENLQKAWNKKNVAIDTATVPTYDERMNEVGFLADPQKLQNVIDFNLFLNDEMADTVLAFSKVVRDASKGKKLILAFYGYGFELSALPISPAISGHFSLRRVLNSPDVDILAGPISYNNRGKGGIKNTMGASESCAIASKIWCDEDDNRTYLMWDSGSILLVPDPNQKTQKDSIAVMHRNLSQQIIRNNPSWWMDLFGTGWYDDPVLWKQISLFKKAELDMIKRPKPYKPPVALIYDEQSMSYIGRNSLFTTGTLMSASRRVAHQIGAPFGQYLLDDILDNKVSPKLNMFLNAISLNAKQRAKMREVAKKSACIYAWTTGYVDTDNRKFSEATIEDATGFKVQKIKEPLIPYAHTTPDGLKLGLPEVLGSNNKVQIDKLFSPIPQEGDVVLANYTNGKPAVVLRKNENNPQLFYGLTYIQPEIMRYMAELAGIHIYTRQPASVFANGSYVSICATTDATHTIDFGCDKKIYNALTGKLIGNGPILNFDMYKGDVLFLRIGKRNK